MNETFPTKEQVSTNEQPKPTIDLANYRESIKGTELEQAFETVVDLCHDLKQNGGKGLMIGGSVRDLYVGKVSKDYDIEIYGMDYDELKEVVGADYKTSEVGKAFGILKVHTDTLDLDLSLPRTDSKVGDGHTGFITNFDKDMTVAEAARRRDFTFNTLGMDPTTGEVFDEYGGIADIQNKVLRVTDPELFKDDPLRVLRAMQFIGRFGLTIAPESKAVLQETAQNINEISKDRFFEEFKKLLLKSEKPSLGLMAALEVGVFEQFFPHFLVMKETPQDKEWHPEGDVWIHTLMVVDEAATLVKNAPISEEQKLVIMLGALLHDVGKPETTYTDEAGHIVSPGHEQKGEAKAREFLSHINAPKEITEKVIKLVTNHMMPGSLYRTDEKGTPITDSAIRRLAKKLHPATIEELILVSNADSFGRGIDNPKTVYKPGEWLTDFASRLGIEREQPEKMLRGKDLIEAGLKPDRIYGAIITTADRLRALRETLAKETKSEEIESLKEEVLELLGHTSTTTEALNALRDEALATIQEIRNTRAQD